MNMNVAILATMKKLDHVQGRGTDMRRDMELVREIFRVVIAKEGLEGKEISIPGYDAKIVNRHVSMLYRAGYIDGTPFMGDERILAVDLSWQGHEFAGALLTEETVWVKIKDALGPEKLATVPLKYIEAVAMEALIAWGKAKLGLGG
ncbi:DUF2513 domain-containing protein [Shinella pollutisoli]|uniref:DUF2513 domain-containing protein n=1 Tax=Shinella pollutisoli TaxID=2250594 RepID=A0ABV7DC34_9HYPH|nr:DUF2513 domain-containing protein [Shinella pollutisoli]